MRTIPGMLLPHTVTVQPYEGTGAHGPIYGEPRTARAAVEDSRRLVRGTDGNEVVSEATVYTKPHHSIPAESRVTVWPGTNHERTSDVITSSRHTYPGTPGHLELALT